MACTVEFCVSTIVDNDVEGFDLLLQSLVRQIIANQRSKSILKFRWVCSIPVFCTLCNNPEFITKLGGFRRQLMNVYELSTTTCMGHKCTVIDLADALNYEQCSKELLKLYAREEIDIHEVRDFDIFAAILSTGKLYSILDDYGLIVKTLKCLCENGRDIRASGPGGRSVLQEAVINMSPYEIFEAIISQGGDVNCTDDYGTSAFSKFLFKAVYFKGRQEEIVKILKLFLYQNPTISTNTAAIESAIQYDRTVLPDVPEKAFTDDMTHENEAHSGAGKHVQPQEELRLLPWLYRYGFPISQTDINELDMPSLFDDTLTYKLNLDHPRELKDIARIKIRMTYPGIMLHNVLNAIKIPRFIKDYIFIEEFSSELH